jgi:hypothetical protein
MKPLCFVAMPSGRKSDPSGATVDFDAVYRAIVAPAIKTAEMEPVLVNADLSDGAIPASIFEPMMLCDSVIVDVTLANARILYELGILNAVKPGSTVLIRSQTSGLPLGRKSLPSIPYHLDVTGTPEDEEGDKDGICRRLERKTRTAVNTATYFAERSLDIARLSTDLFRERAEYSDEWKQRLAGARAQDKDAVRQAGREIISRGVQEYGVLVDLLLSYRAVECWPEMVELVDQNMPKPLAATLMIQEQLGLALIRLNQVDRADKILKDLIDRHGFNSETCGIRGRIYKGQWERAREAGDTPRATELLKQAIDAYREGFEADWRDAYPGINAVTLMDLKEPPDDGRNKLMPVVAYAVERRIALGKADYWDYATQVELAVLNGDEAAAKSALNEALKAMREAWELKSTEINVNLIRRARLRREMKAAQEIGKEVGKKAAQKVVEEIAQRMVEEIARIKEKNQGDVDKIAVETAWRKEVEQVSKRASEGALKKMVEEASKRSAVQAVAQEAAQKPEQEAREKAEREAKQRAKWIEDIEAALRGRAE